MSASDHESRDRVPAEPGTPRRWGDFCDDRLECATGSLRLSTPLERRFETEHRLDGVAPPHDRRAA